MKHGENIINIQPKKEVVQFPYNIVVIARHLLSLSVLKPNSRAMLVFVLQVSFELAN